MCVCVCVCMFMLCCVMLILWIGCLFGWFLDFNILKVLISNDTIYHSVFTGNGMS